LHSRLLYRINDYNVEFGKHPLAFLLIYCDLLHEWGRGFSEASIDRLRRIEEDAPKLNSIEIPKDNSDKSVSIGIGLDSDLDIKSKEKEINKVFQRIASEDIEFSVKLNNRKIPLE